MLGWFQPQVSPNWGTMSLPLRAMLHGRNFGKRANPRSTSVTFLHCFTNTPGRDCNFDNRLRRPSDKLRSALELRRCEVGKRISSTPELVLAGHASRKTYMLFEPCPAERAIALTSRRKSSVSIKANVFTSLRRFAWLCRLSPANALRFLACRLKEEPMTLDNHRLSRSCGICVRKLLRTPIVLDGRNLYSPCQMKAVGLNYISAGRPFALASSSAAECLPLPSPTDNDLWTQDKGSSLGSATQRLPGAII